MSISFALALIGTGSAQAKSVEDIEKSLTHLLAHEPKIMNVHTTQTMGLNQAKTREQPWTGGYWPDISGSIANHYRDRSKIGNQLGFMLRYDVAKARTKNDFKGVREHYPDWNQEERDRKLAPSEKYDLLIGNQNFEFTQAVLDELDFRSEHKPVRQTSGDYAWMKKKGGFPYWSGICDGWAPAAIYLPRPTRPVTLTGASGLPITFFPDDIKALGSYLFARANTPYFATMSYRFAGNACKQKGQPDQDKAGFVSDKNCNDLDAGVWHLALVNRIGLDRMGLEMDVDNNHKINNHPLFDYSLTFYNPKTGKKGSLQESIVARTELNDLYFPRRDPKSVAIVGVKSKVKFSYYIWPEQNRKKTTDAPKDDKFKSGEYTYDLELDADGKILGGEWGNRYEDRLAPREEENEEFSEESDESGIAYNKQPDFIWMAPVNQLPYSQMSLSTAKGSWDNGNFTWAWDGKGAIPEDWLMASKEDQKWEAPVLSDPYSKLKSAQVMSNLIYVLFDLAK